MMHLLDESQDNFLEDVFVNERLLRPSSASSSFSFAVPLPLNLAATSAVSKDMRARLINLVSLWYTPCVAVLMSSAR